MEDNRIKFTGIKNQFSAILEKGEDKK